MNRNTSFFYYFTFRVLPFEWLIIFIITRVYLASEDFNSYFRTRKTLKELVNQNNKSNSHHVMFGRRGHHITRSTQPWVRNVDSSSSCVTDSYRNYESNFQTKKGQQAMKINNIVTSIMVNGIKGEYKKNYKYTSRRKKNHHLFKYQKHWTISSSLLAKVMIIVLIASTFGTTVGSQSNWLTPHSNLKLLLV